MGWMGQGWAPEMRERNPFILDVCHCLCQKKINKKNFSLLPLKYCSIPSLNVSSNTAGIIVSFIRSGFSETENTSGAQWVQLTSWVNGGSLELAWLPLLFPSLLFINHITTKRALMTVNYPMPLSCLGSVTLLLQVEATHIPVGLCRLSEDCGTRWTFLIGQNSSCCCKCYDLFVFIYF